MKQLKTKTDVYSAIVELRNGREPHPKAWAFMWGMSGQAVLDEGCPLERFLYHLEEYERDIVFPDRQARFSPDQAAPTTPADDEDAEADPAIVERFTLARIIEAEAAALPEVQAFREQVLKDRLLPSPADVPGWIEAQAEREKTLPMGTITLRMTRRPDSSAWQDFAPVLRESAEILARQLESGKLPPHIGFDSKSLSYVGMVSGEEWTRAVGVRLNGVLERLHDLARSLVSRCGWHEAAAVGFILAGASPGIRRMTISGTRLRWPYPKLARVVLTVDPRLKPEEVAKSYAQLRDSLYKPGHRVRPMKPERAHLAAFAVERNDGRTWEAIMAEWNAQGDGRRYKELRLFARDVRLAYRLLTGQELRWTNTEEEAPDA